MAASSEIARIEAGLARTRERMGGRIDELQRHLAPRQVLNDALVGVRGGRGADFTDDVVARVKANPVAAGFAGLGIAWLMGSRGAPNPAHARPKIVVGSPPARSGSMVDRSNDDAAASDHAADRHSPSITGTETMTRSNNRPLATVTSNPFALGAAAALVGIIAGALIPTLRREEEALGSVATKLRVAGRDLAQDVVDRGGHVVEDAIGAAKGSADAHGLSAAKPIGEVFADVKSGALAHDTREVAQDTFQAGRDSAQTHLSDATEQPRTAAPNSMA